MTSVSYPKAVHFPAHSMSTYAQILANQANAQKSCGPTTQAGKETSSQNAFKHGLTGGYHNAEMHFLPDEDKSKYFELVANLQREHQPDTATEQIFVVNMAKHEWLRARAVRLQQCCFMENQHMLAREHFNTYIRYETTHERGFINNLRELQRLREQRRKEQIGSVSQKPSEALAAARRDAAEWLEVARKLEKERARLMKLARQHGLEPQLDAEVAPDSVKNAA